MSDEDYLPPAELLKSAREAYQKAWTDFWKLWKSIPRTPLPKRALNWKQPDNTFSPKQILYFIDHTNVISDESRNEVLPLLEVIDATEGHLEELITNPEELEEIVWGLKDAAYFTS